MEKIIVLDFGGQYNQLIARRVRQTHVYSEVLPYTTSLDVLSSPEIKGIIFTGGPRSVYEEGAPSVSKDIFNLKKPILGICRGMQLINIYYGGSLYEDLPSQFGTSISHRDGSDGFTYHMVNFNGSSRIYDKLGGQKSRDVNSMHHEGIRDLAKGLFATATSDDGLVEAIENPYYHSYMMGVQWHPEYSWGKFDELTKIIFDDFSKAL